MKRFKVVCPWDRWLVEKGLGELPNIADVIPIEATAESIARQIVDADAYLATLKVRLDTGMIQQAKNLKAVATPSTGQDHIDVEALQQRGIQFISIKTEFGLLDSFTATAELAWALLLAAVRKIPAGAASANQGNWARQEFTGTQLSRKTFGILGVGRLGKMTAAYASAFRMRVIGCDVKKIDAPNVQQVDFETLLRESDVIGIHIHLTPENTGLLGEKEFAKMKRGVVIVNTSRGAIIDETAFLKALQSGQVGAGGLDVIEGEWRTDLVDHPLIQYAREHDNLVIMPHVGGCTWETQRDSHAFTCNKLAEALSQMTPSRV
jgi:D-3-phosphoglycerate dehydrogenase